MITQIILFVAYYLGLPYTSEEDTYLTETAVEILNGKGEMTEEQAEYLLIHMISPY